MERIFDQELVRRNRLHAISKQESGADFLLQQVAEELAERLVLVERHFDAAAELHGGTGIVAQSLFETGKIGTIRRVETDAAFAPNDQNLHLAPIEEPGLEPQALNLIVSPLALHLVDDVPGVLAQVRRALKPDGLFLAAIPGAGTLAELRDALLSAETEIHGGASPRVVPFADIRAVGALLQRAGFALPVIDNHDYTVRYDSIFPLMRDLKAMGMANPLVARSRKPATRRLLLRAAELYAERYSDPDGRVRATFSIIYVSGWAQHESQQKPLKPGSAKMRLADALAGVKTGKSES